MSEDKLSGQSCVKCGEPLYEGDMFCGNCGKKVLHCAKCGAIMADSAKFCMNCGHCAVVKCAGCGVVLPDGAKFCPECGTSVSENAPAPSEPKVPVPKAKSPAPELQASAPRFEARVGSYVTFGRYPHSGDTPEPIEWLVLDNDGHTALLVSKYGLDCKKFHHEVDISWRDCDLRKWLNGEFLNKAFSSDEQKQITESSIFTGDNPEYGTKGCGETRDRVFCLSIEEAKKYFASANARKCQPTAYAVSRNAYKDRDTGCCWFCLRSPGYSANYAAHVDLNGAVLSSGRLVDYDYNVVRPALRIKL